MKKGIIADIPLKGLTDAQVEESRRMHGSNDLTRKSKNSFLKQFLASFGDPIIKVLLIALFANILFMFRDFNWYETAGIAIAVLLATFVSTLSEYGSESAFEELQADAAKIKCRVQRKNGLIELPIGEVVVGDLILIQSGERIVADGRIISGDLNVDQSALNGETKEAHKYPIDNLQYKRENHETIFLVGNKLFRGSVVCSGEGIMVVERVGDDTCYGSLAMEIQEETIESPLKARLTDLAQTISRLGYAAAAVVVLANLFDNILLDNHFNPVLIAAYLNNYKGLIRDIMRAVTLGITVIVMAVPEGLPMMITVVLSSNMRRMLKDNILVRKLVGIETSGSLNILFTDKTGTLTKGKLEVTTFVDGNGKEYGELHSLKKTTELFNYVRLNCFYNNGAQVSFDGKKQVVIGGNSTDRALLEFVLDDIKDIPDYKKGLSIPFNSADKLSVTEIKGNKRLYLIKGAPESLLPHCAFMLNEAGSKQPLAGTALLKNRLNELARDSVRLLALCISEELPDSKRLDKLTLLGFLGIRDELRDEARAAIKEVTGAGVQVVMITGDNKDTAVSIAAKAGLIRKTDERSVLTSTELNSMSDDEVKSRLSTIRVIARALPSDKSRLVRISQEMGLVAGMTGDGVNDAPALKKADVGFAMGDGTEIAKEAGDIVILDNNISSIVKSILYGRTIFKSIRKFIIFQLSVNLAAVGVSIIGPFIGIETPVTVVQMLWINIIMDTLGGLAYAGEAPLPEYMREAPKSRKEKIINRYMYNQIFFTGIYTTVLCLLFLKLPFIRTMFRPGESYFMTAFFTLFIFTGIFNSFSARTYRINLLAHIVKNKAFILIMCMVTAIQLVMIYYGGVIFRTVGLKLNELIATLFLAASVVFVDLVRKMILRVNNKKGFI